MKSVLKKNKQTEEVIQCKQDVLEEFIRVTGSDHFFCLQTFNDRLLDRLWGEHNGCVLQKLNADDLHEYWDVLPLQCTTRLTDGFVLALGDQNTFRS